MQANVKQRHIRQPSVRFSTRTTEWRPDRSARSALCPMLSAPVGCASRRHTGSERSRCRLSAISAATPASAPILALSQGERHSPKRLSSPRSTSASKHTRLSLSSATVLPRWSAVGSRVGRAGGIDPRSHPRRCSFARRSGSRPSPTAVLAHPRSAALWQTEGRSQSSTNSQPLGSQRMPTPAYALTSPWRRRCRRRTLLR